MKRLIRGLVTAAALVPLFGWAQGQPLPSQGAQGKVTKSQSEDAIRKVLDDYRAAMEARSTQRLAEVMDPDLLLLEGIYTNIGWVDYRDNHIGPEMREWRDFKVSDPTVLEVLVSNDLAYAVEKSTLTIAMTDKTIVLDAAETFILRKGSEGWRIKHLHSSGRKRASGMPAKQ